MTHRSTTINLHNRYCPKALQYHYEGRARDREIFQVGIAAHAVLQAISEAKAEDLGDCAKIADFVIGILTTEGRLFDGREEPPMSPEAAIEGKRIALEYLEFEGPLPKGAAELGLGMDTEGNKASYHDAYYKAAIDLVYSTEEGDEDYSYSVGVVRDYKTSWVADAKELDSLQSKGQAMLLYVNYPDTYQAIRQEIVNLRTGQCHSRTIMLDDAGIALIEQWRDEILLACKAAEAPLIARPGANCAGCPWVISCPDSYFVSIGFDEENRESVCNAYAVTKARLEELERLAKRFCAEGPCNVPGGSVGFFSKSQNEVNDDAAELLFDAWAAAQGGDWAQYRPAVVSLMKGLKLTSGNVSGLAKVLFPTRTERSAREEFVEDCLQQKVVRRFSVDRY